VKVIEGNRHTPEKDCHPFFKGCADGWAPEYYRYAADADSGGASMRATRLLLAATRTIFISGLAAPADASSWLLSGLSSRRVNVPAAGRGGVGFNGMGGSLGSVAARETKSTRGRVTLPGVALDWGDEMPCVTGYSTRLKGSAFGAGEWERCK
jgi:hypothetical protein